MSIQEAREAVEKAAQHYGSQCAAHSMDATAYQGLLEAADAFGLAAHVDACPATVCESVDIETNIGIITGCGDGWYCEKAEALQRLTEVKP